MSETPESLLDQLYTVRAELVSEMLRFLEARDKCALEIHTASLLSTQNLLDVKFRYAIHLVHRPSKPGVYIVPHMEDCVYTAAEQGQLARARGLSIHPCGIGCDFCN